MAYSDRAIKGLARQMAGMAQSSVFGTQKNIYTPKEYAEKIRKAPQAIKTFHQLAMRSFGEIMLEGLRETAPVVTGTFRAGWSLRGPRRSGNSTKFTIVNQVPHAVYIEGGVVPGHKPWPSPGEGTVKEMGLIWSAQAPGGTIKNVIGPQQLDLLTEVLFLGTARAL